MRRQAGDFTLRQLDIFVSVARSGSFALAADQLGISQPAVSDHMSTLERHLGYKLFDRRRGTTPVLTREGFEMLQRAETLLSASQPLRGKAAPRNAEEKTTIRLSLGDRSRDLFLRSLMARIYTELPNIEVQIVPAVAPGQIAAALEKRDIDLLLYTIGRPPLRLPNIHVLGDVPILLVGAPETVHLLETGRLAAEDLQFILPDFGGAAEHWLERQLNAAGIRPRRAVRYLDFPDVIQTIVEEGLGVSILTEEQVAPALAEGRLVRFGPELEPMRRIIARSPRAPRAVDALEQLLITEISRQLRHR